MPINGRKRVTVMITIRISLWPVRVAWSLSKKKWYPLSRKARKAKNGPGIPGTVQEAPAFGQDVQQDGLKGTIGTEGV